MRLWSLLLPVLLAGVLLPASAEEPSMFPFPIQTLNADHDATDMSWMNECPAGKSGFVRVKDGHFVDGKGKRIRFLGVNLCFSAPFTDHASAEKVAARLAKLGVNCVRLHHMDNQYPPGGIWDPAFKDHRHIDAGQLDRLDYLIYQLKVHGIYVDINLHVSRQFNAADGFPDADKLTNYDKGVDNFEPRMIALQKEYAKQLLTHLNPYTKTRYVDEPSVALIEINNENSLVNYCMDGQIMRIPDYYLSEFRRQWNTWLKARYGTTEKLRASWKAGQEPIGANILTNSDFTRGTDRWTLEAPTPAEGSMEVVDAGPSPGVKALHAALTHPGAQPWHFQIHQTGLDLVGGRPYTLRFMARADRTRDVVVYTGLDIEPWRHVGLSRVVQFTPEWRQYEYTFYANGPEKDHNRVSFNCQNEVGEVWLANVELHTGGGGGLPDSASLDAGNIGLPMDTYTMAQRTDFLDFAAETERAYAVGMRDYVKNTLGAHAQVVDTQTSYGGIAGMYRESLLDYGDMHGYWQHPSFPHKSWDSRDWRITNTPMVNAPGNNTLMWMALNRIAGKPYTISEYNHPAPNDYAAECVPMLAAFAAHQDWDGIFLFDYHSGGDWDRDAISGYFSIDSNPSKIAFFPMAAAAFRRGDVSPAPRSIVADFPVPLIPGKLMSNGANASGMWHAAGVENADTLTARTGVRFVEQGTKPVIHRQGRGLPPSITWKASDAGKGSFLVNSPATRAMIGYAPESRVKLGGLSIKPANPSKFASITVTALDGKPVEQSAHLLIAAVGRVENTGMVWNEDRTSVSNQWGHGPAIAEGISAKITLASNASGASVYALDGGGGRVKSVPCAVKDGSLNLDLGPESQTLWYEVVLRR